MVLSPHVVVIGAAVAGNKGAAAEVVESGAMESDDEDVALGTDDSLEREPRDLRLVVAERGGAGGGTRPAFLVSVDKAVSGVVVAGAVVAVDGAISVGDNDDDDVVVVVVDTVKRGATVATLDACGESVGIDEDLGFTVMRVVVLDFGGGGGGF